MARAPTGGSITRSRGVLPEYSNLRRGGLADRLRALRVETMQQNYYQATRIPAPGFESLRGPIDTRVAIVGGGYSGLATALGLAERGIRDVALAEAHTIGHGAAGRNGGFVFGGYSLGEGDLLRQLGP